MVCASWVWLNRATSMRNAITIFGDVSKPYVREANLHVSRCALLMRLALAKRCKPVLETPATSIIEYHPRLQEIWDQCELESPNKTQVY